MVTLMTIIFSTQRKIIGLEGTRWKGVLFYYNNHKKAGILHDNTFICFHVFFSVCEVKNEVPDEEEEDEINSSYVTNSNQSQPTSSQQSSVTTPSQDSLHSQKPPTRHRSNTAEIIDGEGWAINEDINWNWNKCILLAGTCVCASWWSAKKKSLVFVLHAYCLSL